MKTARDEEDASLKVEPHFSLSLSLSASSFSRGRQYGVKSRSHIPTHTYYRPSYSKEY